VDSGVERRLTFEWIIYVVASVKSEAKMITVSTWRCVTRGRHSEPVGSAATSIVERKGKALAV